MDLHPDCSYYPLTQLDQTYVKRYAARISKLDLTKGRNLFAAVEFPVLINNLPPAPDEPVAPSTAILDEMFIEAAEYDDGFSKIVHNYQPVTNSLLQETQDDEYPVTNDIGIRMGWDDEQLGIWHARQLNADPATGKRPDAPLGVYQYRIDVRERRLVGPPNDWIPLCRVRYDKDVSLDATLIGHLNEELEMGVEVYPAQLDADSTAPFWLPAYFSQWIGNSLVLQDENAIAIYQKDKIDKNHLGPKNLYDPSNDAPFVATKNNFYQAVGLDKIELLYGKQYEFRVRLADITGGGPIITDNPIYGAASPISLCHFVRHVIPQQFNFLTPIPSSDTAIFTASSLTVQRPLLGYPSILFTGGYTDTVNKLIADGNTIINSYDPMTKIQKIKRDVGLYDPDVDRMEILVEVKALGMDTTIRKKDPKDSYALLYVTNRKFPIPFEVSLDVPFVFIDAPNLSFVGSQQLPDLGLNSSGKTNIDDRTDIVLPTARDIRITVRAVTQTKPDYYGGVNPDGSNRTELKGIVSSFITRKAAISEKNLFKPIAESLMIRGVYLQPDEPITITANINNLLIANLASDNQIPNIMQRLAAAIGTESKGASLLGKQGQRWQFSTNRFIRHTASPDNTSITFATNSDLLNHWIVPITLLIDRDWTWDDLQPISMTVYRRKIFLLDAMSLMGYTDRQMFLNKFSSQDILTNASVIASVPEEQVGDLELKRTINIQALSNSDRSQTYCCFLDAVEPKPLDDTKFPDEILVSYRIAVNYQVDGGGVTPLHDTDQVLYLHLPITIPPAQSAKIVSAGIAFSKYVRDKNYANTENREKYLWVELDAKPSDPNDAYYARYLAYAPDTLLARWEPDLLIAPQEPALPIDPEQIRIISPASSDDHAGLSAMQEMTKAKDSDVHYLVPLPPGLHPDSLEMFGFFTYEFRVGHKVPWSTAQGRFGRPIRNTGVQHPLPQLYCLATRNEKFISVTAPYAQTVFNGRNVTAKPPRTEIWALLYAQVRMADDSDERNVLLSDRKLFIQQDNLSGAYLYSSNTNSDATPQGVTGWLNSEVETLLALYGLPLDSPLSVLCVEMTPGYDHFLVGNQHNIQSKTHFSQQTNQSMETYTATDFKNYISGAHVAMESTRANVANNDRNESALFQNAAAVESGPRPLTTDLGNHRILRTSLLIAIPEVCCTNC